jgi:hypothetical protein
MDAEGMGRSAEGKETQTTDLLQLTFLPSFVFSQGKGKWD